MFGILSGHDGDVNAVCAFPDGFCFGSGYVSLPLLKTLFDTRSMSISDFILIQLLLIQM